MITLNSNGFFFFSNGRFINPGNLPHNYQAYGYQLANYYVQVIMLCNTYCLKLVKQNIPPMKGNYNKEYYNNKPWKYVDKYDVGSFSNPFPSGLIINNQSQALRVCNLNPEIAINFFFSKTLYSDNKSLLQQGELQYIYKPIEVKPKIKLVSLNKQAA